MDEQMVGQMRRWTNEAPLRPSRDPTAMLRWPLAHLLLYFFLCLTPKFDLFLLVLCFYLNLCHFLILRVFFHISIGFGSSSSQLLYLCYDFAIISGFVWYFVIILFYFRLSFPYFLDVFNILFTSSFFSLFIKFIFFLGTFLRT